MTRPLLSLRDVGKGYDGRAAVDRLSLDIRDGEFLTLLGPSGCGKTTLLRLIAGFERPDSGSIALAGTDITALPPEQRPLNTVFQNYALFPHLNVFDNVAYGLRREGRPKGEIAARVAAALAMVELGEFARRKPHQLSGGQQQRVAIARAVVKRPRLLLLDEPLSALDYQLRRAMRSELKRLQRDLGIAFLFVTHDQEEALAMSDRIAVLRDGAVQQLGTPREIYERPANLFTARFVGETNLFPARVVALHGDRVLCDIRGLRRACQRPDFPVAVGQDLHLLLRPEDLRVLAPDAAQGFPGSLVERSYRGSTLEIRIRLDDGQQVLVSCAADAPEVAREVGESVTVGWSDRWEWLLPADA